jgi:hypothetical protein
MNKHLENYKQVGDILFHSGKLYRIEDVRYNPSKPWMSVRFVTSYIVYTPGKGYIEYITLK